MLFKKENRKYWFIFLAIVVLLFLAGAIFGWFDGNKNAIGSEEDPIATQAVVDSMVNARLASYGLIIDSDRDGYYDIDHLETVEDSEAGDQALGNRITNQNSEIDEAKKSPKQLYYGGDIRKINGKISTLEQENEALKGEIERLKKNGAPPPKITKKGDGSGNDDGEIDWRKEFGIDVNATKTTKSDPVTSYSNPPGNVTNYEWIGHIGGLYGVTVNGIGYVHKEVVDLVHGSNPSFMCEYTNWYDNGAPMTLTGDYWMCDTGHELKAEEKNRIFTYCIYIGGQRYLPHELHKLGQIPSGDYVANGQGGFNFTTYPTGELKVH